MSQQLPAALSAFVVDPALGACLDAAGAANSWSTPAQVTSLSCLATLLGSGVITQPASCLGEGELVFNVLNPGKPTTNAFGFAAASTAAGDIVTSAITYNPGTDAYDGRVYLGV